VIPTLEKVEEALPTLIQKASNGFAKPPATTVTFEG
jgi:hypothetical protein